MGLQSDYVSDRGGRHERVNVSVHASDHGHVRDAHGRRQSGLQC